MDLCAVSQTGPPAKDPSRGVTGSWATSRRALMYPIPPVGGVSETPPTCPQLAFLEVRRNKNIARQQL